MSVSPWLADLLKQRGVFYREVHPSLGASTAQELAQRGHFTGNAVAKVVVAFAGTRPIQLVLPAARRVSLSKLEELNPGEAVRFATEAEMGRLFPDCEVGAEPVEDVEWRDLGAGD